MDRSKREAHQPAELDQDKAFDGFEIRISKRLSDQIRRRDKENRRERDCLVGDEERKVRPLHPTEDVVSKDRIGHRYTE